MRLLLTNYETETSRGLEVDGNPLLTYNDFRAGSGVPKGPEGDGTTILYFEDDRWTLAADGSKWTMDPKFLDAIDWALGEDA